MIEPEICFAGLNELFLLVEYYIKFCIDYAFSNVIDDIEYFNTIFKKNTSEKRPPEFSDLVEYLKGIRNSAFNKMSYSEAIEYLTKVE